MKLDYNKKELQELMKDFFLLTGIRIVLFDSDYTELLSYPESHCRFCAHMKSRSETSRLCDESDRNSFSECKLKNEIIIYHCHAGLIEATAPLKDHNTVIGYLMFGQISDAANEQELAAVLSEHLNRSSSASGKHDFGTDIARYLSDIPMKSAGQIRAAARIMEACTFCIILKNTVTARRDNFIRNMDSYLMEHLADDLSIHELSKAFGISKSKLYQQFSIYYDTGIADHIRHLRIERARQLLTDTELSVTEISSAVGFADYNYFCRVFKKEVGISAKKYRASSLPHCLSLYE